jgi:hypothetical protein
MAFRRPALLAEPAAGGYGIKVWAGSSVNPDPLLQPRSESPSRGISHEQRGSLPTRTRSTRQRPLPVEAQVAERVRSSAEAIRQQVRNTLESAIKIGQELLAVKEALPHGQFLPWLRAEFGWAERTARNFMAVAEQFVHLVRSGICHRSMVQVQILAGWLCEFKNGG